MNHRVLELLKAPKNIQSEDLNLLKEEINSFPYVQNIRALYLYGVHLYDKENYQKVLSATAAYTTDKKILYQLINGKIQQNPLAKVKPDYAGNPLKILYKSKTTNFPIEKEEEEVPADVENEVEDIKIQIESEDKKNEIISPQQEEIRHIFVNGERNRILFEGEENFLHDDQVETIDLESTLESGSIVTQKVEKIPDVVVNQEDDVQVEEFSSEVENHESVSEIEEFIPEIVVGEENINAEEDKEEVLNESQRSFEEVEPISEIENSEIESEQESEEIVVEEEASGFIPDTIIEEENINTDTDKEKVLDELQSNFEEIPPVISEIQNIDNEENKFQETISDGSENPITETAEFTPETIINEDEISSETEVESVNDESELSFHGTESFLPDVKMQVSNSDEIKEEVSGSNINKHEDEMRRLIEEVEKKMKEKAASEIKKEEEPKNTGHDISFAETQSFNFIPVETKAEEEKNETVLEEKSQDITEVKSEPSVEEPVQTATSWKPMSFESHVPDSMIDKVEIQTKSESEVLKVEDVKVETPSITESIAQETLTLQSTDIPEIVEEAEVLESVQENEEIHHEEEKEDAPVMTVSFFGSDISKLTAENSKTETVEEEKTIEVEAPVQKATSSAIDSNIPGFINTWQSWLKIDRTEEVEKEKDVIKTKAIETFIENNPKISQLKDDVTYVIKEKNDDISHLMTETLASLYFEQKLYTKAIRAFELLIDKNPEKEEYFKGKIQEIKDFRSKGN
jgi:hypothetical protein